MKKLICLFLTLVMVLTPLSALAATEGTPSLEEPTGPVENTQESNSEESVNDSNPVKIEAAAKSSFSVSKITAPSSIKYGGKFILKGKITSANTMNKVHIGIADCNGAWIESHHYSANPKSKTFDVFKADSKIVFGKLKPGVYSYLIYAKDSKLSSSQLIYKKSFKVTYQAVPAISSVVPAGDSLTLNWTKLAGADGYDLYRSTSANGAYSLVYSTAGTSFTNSSLGFSKTYFYKVQARNSGAGGNYKGTFSPVVSGTTQVTTASNYSISGFLAPSSLNPGNSFALAGIVNSSNTMTRLEVGIVKDGHYMSGYKHDFNPNAKTYNLGQLSLAFNTLSAGTYNYRIWATDANGATRIASQDFQIKAPATSNSTTSAARVVSIATSKSFVGKNLSSVKKAMKKKGYSLWRPNHKGAWCAWYVSNCAKAAGVSDSVVKRMTIADRDWYKSRGLYKKSKYRGGTYTPKPGDLIYFTWNGRDWAAHIGIVRSVSKSTVYTVEGNSSSKVRLKSYSLNSKYILGYSTPKYK